MNLREIFTVHIINSTCFQEYTLYIFMVVFIIVSYLLFFVPCNWKKIEFEYLTGGGINVMNRKASINNLRKNGPKELPPPYPNGWYSILESFELKRGEVKNVFALGKQFAVFRTLSSSVYVLDAYCPHLGANIGTGRVFGDTVECPFHKWRFRGTDGACVFVPYSSCVPKSSKLQKWTSREVNDHIFVWYSADPELVPWEIPALSEIEIERFVYHGRNEFFVNSHIQEIPENGADIAHFGAVHDNCFLSGTELSHKSIFKDVGVHNWQPSWKPTNIKHIAIVTLKHSLVVAEKFNVFQMDITGEQIGPSYVHLHLDSPSFGRIKVVQTVTPIAPLIQRVIHRFYAIRILAPVIKCIIFAESVMFERDMNMWNHKIFRRRPCLVKEDMMIVSFRNWFEQFYSENSLTFSEAYENISW
ncbi:cholesterol 7-desaturase nvd isoform X2 [Musca domestica]|uniref:cholesterol 7-desaturase n=1 Tax=Musca domestica TaxID=7370 RepID=A0ABM3VAS7_MUSDO|nr:cholesterol 7-desaturase nvd isoform X2 [Musca domestica]